MDNKRRLFRLIEVYLNGFKGDLVESIYGNRSRIKVHTVTFGVSDNSVLVEVIVLLGETINEEILYNIKRNELNHQDKLHPDVKYSLNTVNKSKRHQRGS